MKESKLVSAKLHCDRQSQHNHTLLQVWSEPSQVEAAAYEFQETEDFLKAGTSLAWLSRANQSMKSACSYLHPVCRHCTCADLKNRRHASFLLPCIWRSQPASTTSIHSVHMIWMIRGLKIYADRSLKSFLALVAKLTCMCSWGHCGRICLGKLRPFAFAAKLSLRR